MTESSASTPSSTTRPPRWWSTGDRRRGRGGALQPAQARQAAGAVLDLGAARAGGRAGACAEAGLGAADLDAVAYSYDPAPGAPGPAATSRPTTVGGPAHAVRAARAAVPRRRRCPAWTRTGSASCRTTSPTRPRPTCAARLPSLQRAGARRARRARLPPGRPRTRGRRARGAGHPARCRTRSACSTRSSPPTSASCAPRDEYKVMALASLRRRRALPRRSSGSWSAPTATAASAPSRSTWAALAPPRAPGEELDRRARRPGRQRPARGWRRCCSTWPAGCTRAPATAILTMAGGVALNCVANSRLAARGPVRAVWVQPAAGDAGHRARRGPARRRRRSATRSRRCARAGLGRGLDRRRARGGWLRHGRRRRSSGPPDLADAVAEVLADDGVVAWFQGRREYGPRALGHRSLLADPRQRGQPGAAQRRQGPRAVPAGRADGPGRAGRRDLRRRPAAQPVHAVRRTTCRAGWRGPDPGRRARRRHRPDPDRRPRARSRWWPRCSSAFERAHRRAGRGQHQPQHRRAADGRRPAGRARVLRLGAGRRAGHRPVPGAARRCRDRAGVDPRDVVIPTVGPAVPDAIAASAALAAATGPAPERVVRGRRPAAPGPRRCAVPVGRCCRWSPRGRRAGRRRPATSAGGRPRRLGRVPRRRRACRGRTGWRALAADLAGLPAATSAASRAGSRCRCRPAGGRPTGSAARAGLETRALGHRRHGLPARRRWRAVGGFDERFPRAYREDADLALRLHGRRLADRAPGARAVVHPVRPASPLGQRPRPGRQRRRRADAARCTGRGWRAAGRRARAGRRPRHLAITAAAGAPPRRLAARRPRRRRPSRRRPPGWPGPREFAVGADRARPADARARSRAMARDQRAVIRRSLAGRALAARRVRARRRRAARRGRAARRPRAAAVLFDRDGTLVRRRAVQRRSRRGSSRCRAPRRR